MKTIQKTALILLIISSLNVQSQKTILKGKVHKWVSDTVYVSKLSFHSPHSSWIQKKVIAKDSTFIFEWDNIKEPFVLSISSLNTFAKQACKHLVFENMTEKHSQSYCLKFYQNGSTLFYIEPNTTLKVDLTSNTWYDTLSNKKAAFFRKKGVKIGKDNRVKEYGKTTVKFIGKSDNFANRYFLNFPYQINKIEKAIDTYSSKNLNMAIANIKNVEKYLTADLNKHKHQFAKNLYEYLLGEITYGIKKELFKYLVLDQPEFYKSMIKTGKIPNNIANIIALGKNSITTNTLKGEMYAEYIEFYLNFTMNLIEKKRLAYRKFDMNKLEVAIEELPKESAYYYIANNLIETKNKSAFKEIINRFIDKYPNGELNQKIIDLYKNR